MSRAWFRMYAEFGSDPKVQLLAFEDQRHFVVLLCLKCNGTLDSAVPSPDYLNKMIAKALGLSVDAALEVRRRLIEVGLVNDQWQPVKWDLRQYESDSSASRTRAWRERSHRDVTVTDQNRPEQTRTEHARTRASAPGRARAAQATSEPRTPSVESARPYWASIIRRSFEGQLWLALGDIPGINRVPLPKLPSRLQQLVANVMNEILERAVNAEVTQGTRTRALEDEISSQVDEEGRAIAVMYRQALKSSVAA